MRIKRYQEGGNMQDAIAQLVQAASAGDLNAIAQIQEIAKAAEQGDQTAAEMLSVIQEMAQAMQGDAVPALKCGGRIKSKKASAGMPLKRCNCGTKLHKVGGRIIEVDCNGIPVKKFLYGGIFANHDLFKGLNRASRNTWLTGVGKLYALANGITEQDIADYMTKNNAATNIKLSKLNKAGFDKFKADQEAAAAEEAAKIFGNDMTNAELLALEDPTKLSTDAAERLKKLLEYQAARNKSLTFNGKQYADETAYNAAVDAANAARMAEYDTLYKAYNNARNAVLGDPTKIGEARLRRRARAWDLYEAVQNDPSIIGSMSHRDLSRYLRAQKRLNDLNVAYQARPMAPPTRDAHYSGNAALTQDQLNAKTFRKGGMLSYLNFFNC